jgi:hypothetical protein
MSRKGLLVAVAVIVVANAVTLTMIAMNRLGQADATIRLTEREARLPAPGVEDTGIALSVAWRRPNDVNEGDMPQFAWFDRPKLQTIGFDCSVAPDGRDAEKHYAFVRTLPRAVYAVLEYRADAGPTAGDEDETATPPAILSAPQPPGAASRRLEPLSESDLARLSRLVPIDVGISPSQLRTRYPDRQRFVVTPAIAELRLMPQNGTTPARLAGFLTAIVPSEVYVPKEHRALFDRLRAADKSDGRPWLRLRHDPRFQVTVKYGSRLEPWIEKVEAIGNR